MMKPKIGQKIYVIIDHHICAQTVGYLGEDTFICEGYESLRYPELCYEPGFFAGPEGRWFPTLEKAQEAYKRKYPSTVRFEEIREGEEWEAIEEAE